MVVLDDRGVHAPAQSRTSIADLLGLARLWAEGRQRPPQVVSGPIGNFLGATDFAGPQELSTGLEPLAPPDALARFEAAIRNEVERRDREAAHGTDR